MKKLNLDPKTFDPRTVMGMISRAKDKLMTPKQFAADAAGDYFREKVSDIYRQYEKEMKKACALDFDDIIMKTVLLLQNNPEVLEFYQHKFRYVLVDEYQDTNYAQYVLTSLLAGYYENICVVGDDDQSIYKFRGATITNILEFEKQFKDAKTIRLEQNYRSTGNILNAANEVIRNNVGRKGKELWTDHGAGAKIKLHRSDSQEGEAGYIADTIREGVEQGRRWGDFAVLYRNNVLSDNIAAAFIRAGVPYRVYKGRDFFSRAEIKDMFAYLWMIENPADELRLRRIINVPARKIGDKSVETAMQAAVENGVTLYDVVCHASEYPALSRGAAAMEKFGEMIENLRRLREFVSLSELYDELLDKSGYLRALQLKGGAEEESRIEHIEELKSYIVDYEEKNENPSLGDFLENMALYTDADQSGEDEDAVIMMTMHAAKGLEFPVVFLAGMEDGLFPGFRAMEKEEDMEEERRLCYVAVTRAKEQLYLTCAERRLLYGRTQYAHPSRFIDEMPEELLDSNIVESRRFSAATAPDPTLDRPQVMRARYVSAGAAKPVHRSHRQKPAVPLPDYAAGDRVRHRAFRRRHDRFRQADGRRRAARDRLRSKRAPSVSWRRVQACSCRSFKVIPPRNSFYQRSGAVPHVSHSFSRSAASARFFDAADLHLRHADDAADLLLGHVARKAQRNDLPLALGQALQRSLERQIQAGSLFHALIPHEIPEASAARKLAFERVDRYVSLLADSDLLRCQRTGSGKLTDARGTAEPAPPARSAPGAHAPRVP